MHESLPDILAALRLSQWIMLISGIVFVVGVLLVVVGKCARGWLRRKFEAWIARDGLDVVAGPEYGSFRGARKDYGKVKCDGMIAMTAEQLVFYKLIGGRLAIGLDDITDVEVRSSFLHAWRAGQPVIVLTTRDGNEIGFFVRDSETWKELIRERMTHSEQETHG